MLHRDGIDVLYDFEEFQFYDQIYTLNTILKSDESINGVPNQFALHLPYPNPFNPMVNIFYDIPNDDYAIVQVLDINGKVVYTIHDSRISPGKYHAKWNAKDTSGNSVSAGVYFIRFSSTSFNKTAKILFLK